MCLKKIILIKFILIFFLINTSLSLENKIILKIDKDIITSIDIENESKYLSALNPKIMELNDIEIFEISKNSLIREKIKKIEILKNANNPKLNDNLLDNIIRNKYVSLGLKTEDEFIGYLKNFDVKIDTVIEKIEIEALWNQLIFFKFSKNINIDKKKLIEKIKKNKDLNSTKELFLKEIVFNIEEDSNLNEKYNLIKKSILNAGFANTASIYSVSDTAKIGGVLGWVNENSLNSKISKALTGLKLNEFSKPIALPGGFLILQISDERIIKKKLNIDKELELAINNETNRQLNQFSNIFFNKSKKEITINEI